MLRVRHLAELAWRLPVDSFVAKIGPIGLVQQPPPAARVALVREKRPQRTVPLPTLNANTLPALGKFEDLLVATLPAALPDGTVQLVIGRNPENDLVVEDPAVSGRHAAIRWDGKKGIIVELGSANGTFINLQKMGTQATLKNGDELSFGLSVFLFLHAPEFHARLKQWSTKPP
jgi:hypothetical protein